MRIGLGIGLNRFRGGQAGAAGVVGLLDSYKGSAFAMSPDTLLYSTYSATDDIAGSVTNGDPGQFSVTVLRDSDNAVRSFTPAEVADGTANTWVQAAGAANGLVRRGYDQSVTALDVSNLKHADQSDPTKMPKLFDSSTGLIVENGKAAMDISSGDHFTFSTDAFAGKYPDLITVSSITSYSQSGCMLLASTTGQNLYWQFGPTSLFWVQGSPNSGAGISIADGQTRVLNLSAEATRIYVRYNGVQYQKSLTFPTIGTGSKDYFIYIYPPSGNWNWIGKSQCVIIYPDRQDTTDKEAIEGILNTEYNNIY